VGFFRFGAQLTTDQPPLWEAYFDPRRRAVGGRLCLT